MAQYEEKIKDLLEKMTSAGDGLNAHPFPWRSECPQPAAGESSSAHFPQQTKAAPKPDCRSACRPDPDRRWYRESAYREF